MTKNRRIVIAFAALVMLVTVLPVFAPAHACEMNATIIASSGGSTNPTPGNYSYTYGTNLTVTAAPDDGYRLSSWLLDGSPAGNSTNMNVTMNSDHTIEAVFAVDAPEFPNLAPLAIFLIALLFIALLYRKTHRSKKPAP